MSQEFLASSVASRLGARIVDGDLQAGDVLRLGDIEPVSYTHLTLPTIYSV